MSTQLYALRVTLHQRNAVKLVFGTPTISDWRCQNHLKLYHHVLNEGVISQFKVRFYSHRKNNKICWPSNKTTLKLNESNVCSEVHLYSPCWTVNDYFSDCKRQPFYMYICIYMMVHICRVNCVPVYSRV